MMGYLTGFVARQQGRLVLWLPVAMGVGAAAYLTMPFEPVWLWSLGPAIVALFALILSYRFRLSVHVVHVTWICLFVAFGFAVGKLRTERVRAPVISPAESQYSVTAFIIDNVSPSADQPRLLLAPIALSGIAPDATPLRLRVSLKPGIVESEGLSPGDAVTAFALLDPPPPPSLPGGYDPARGAYFQAVGGVGFLPGKVERIAPPPHSLRLTLVMTLNRLRWDLSRAIDRQITPGFPGDPGLGGFAAALVTGQQAMVPQALIGSMRASGLAHILSISGVHMAVVGGFVFFALRAVLALIPAIALRMPVKKVAAAISLVCILFYLGLSGMPAPAIRAAVVTCVAFGAVLVDRRALSLRSLAIAAMIIIAATPDAVIQPGFQMSFAATAALLAVFEALHSEIRELSVPWWVRTVQKTVEGVRLSLAVSLVATLSTLPLAVAYFNRISLYGLVSNLFEAPLTGFVIMPCLAIGAVLIGTPFGWMFLRVAAMGLWLIERIAAVTAALPYSVISWPSAPTYILPVSLVGVFWCCLIRGHVRWLGVVVASAALWWPRDLPPEVWIDAQGGNAAVRTEEGSFALRDKARRYGFEQWTQHYGLRALGDEARDKDYECHGYVCIAKPSSPVKISFWFSNVSPKPELLAQMCASSTMVILRSPVTSWPQKCAGIQHLTADDFKQLGAVELTRSKSHWSVTATQPRRGRRYWSSWSEAEVDDQ